MTSSLPPSLRRGPLGGVFFLHGPEELRKEEAVRALVDRHVDPGVRDFNLDVFRGSEVELDDLASAIATPPMMAEWRVVVLREVERLASSSRARELLLEAAKKPPPGLALILVATEPRGSKAKFYRDLERHARSVSFAPVAPEDLPAWLMERAREHHGVELEEGAARALAAGVGSDLGILARELEKLTEVAGNGGPITLAHVEAAGTRIPRQDRWEWMDLVGEKRFREAADALGTLVAQGESEVGLASGLATHLLRLGLVTASGGRRVEEALPPHLRSWKGMVNRLRRQARRWSVEEVEEAILGLLRAEQLLKGSTVARDVVLEEWLLALAVRSGGEAGG